MQGFWVSSSATLHKIGYISVILWSVVYKGRRGKGKLTKSFKQRMI